MARGHRSSGRGEWPGEGSYGARNTRELCGVRGQALAAERAREGRAGSRGNAPRRVRAAPLRPRWLPVWEWELMKRGGQGEGCADLHHAGDGDQHPPVSDWVRDPRP